MLGNFLGGLANLGGISAGVDDAQTRAYRLALQQLAVQQARQQQQAQSAMLPTLRALASAQQQTAPPGPTPLPQPIQQQPLAPLPQNMANLPQVPQTGGAMSGQLPPPGPPQTAGGFGVGGAGLPSRMTSDQVASGQGPWAQPAPGSGLSVPQLGIQERAGADPTRLQLASADQTHQQLRASIPPQVQQPAMQGAQALLQSMGNPLQFVGRLSLVDLVKAIDKANPNADESVKSAIFTNLYPMLNTQGKLGFSEAIQLLRLDQQKEEFTQRQKQQREEFTQRQEGIDLQHSFMRQMALTRGAGGGRPGKPQQLDITMPDGSKRQVTAQEVSPGNWVDAFTNQPLNIPPGTDIGAVKSPGRQAAAQVNSMINAGNEAVAAVGNLVDLPITATSGWLKGTTQQTPEGMFDALKRSLGNNLTSDEAKSVVVSFQGVARAMATLEAAGRATGLVGLTQQAQILMPQEGDSGLTVLRKYAEIRQLTERSLETMAASPDVSKDQKTLMQNIAGEMKRAVPWTVKDINALERDPSDTKVSKFAEQYGAEGAAARQPTTDATTSVAVPDAFKGDPDGTGYQKDGAVWVKQGERLIKTPGAVLSQ